MRVYTLKKVVHSFLFKINIVNKEQNKLKNAQGIGIRNRFRDYSLWQATIELSVRKK